MLTQAVEIFKHKIESLKIAPFNQYSSRSALIFLRRQSGHLAESYGVTVRTVQDIWNRRSWAFATSHLWPQESDKTKPSRYSLMSAAEVIRPEVANLTGCFLDSSLLQTLQLRRPGRPRGAKDQHPRGKTGARSSQAYWPCGQSTPTPYYSSEHEPIPRQSDGNSDALSLENRKNESAKCTEICKSVKHVDQFN